MNENENLQFKTVKQQIRNRNITSFIIIVVLAVFHLMTCYMISVEAESSSELSSKSYFFISIFIFFMMAGVALNILLQLNNLKTKSNWNINHPEQTIYSSLEKPIGGSYRWQAEKLRGILNITMRVMSVILLFSYQLISLIFGYKVWILLIYFALVCCILGAASIITAVWNRKHPDSRFSLV